MRLPVRSKNAMLLGNGLIAHIRTLQEYRKTHGKLPTHPYLTYTQLREQTGAQFAMVGIGQFLGELMEAIHTPDMPKAMRGLTLFVTPVGGTIDYTKGSDDWYGINTTNSPRYRAAVLDQDWSEVTFVSNDQ